MQTGRRMIQHGSQVVQRANVRVSTLLDSRMGDILERVFVVLAFFSLTTPFIWLMEEYGRLQVISASQITRLLAFFVYGVALFLGLRYWRAMLAVARANKVFVLFLVLVGLSTLWSDTAGFTLRRVAALWLATWFGLYVGIRFSLRDQLALLGAMFAIVVVLTYLAVLLFPEYSIMSHPHEGSWRGIYPQKNALGPYISLACPVFALLALASRERGAQLRYVALLLVSVVILVFSSSRGSFITVMVTSIVLGAIVFYWRWRAQTGFSWRYAAVIVGVVVLAGILVGATIVEPERELVDIYSEQPEEAPPSTEANTGGTEPSIPALTADEFAEFQRELGAAGIEITINPAEQRWTIVAIDPGVNPEAVLRAQLSKYNPQVVTAPPRIVPMPARFETALVERLDDLGTGRMVLWLELFERVKERPFWGYGYDSYWQRAAPIQWYENQWSVDTSAHNMYLEYLLDVGFVGLGLFLISYFQALWRAYKLLPATRRTLLTAWPLLYLVWVFVFGFWYSRFNSSNSFYWPIFIAVIASLPGLRAMYGASGAQSAASERQTATFDPVNG